MRTQHPGQERPRRPSDSSKSPKTVIQVGIQDLPIQVGIQDLPIQVGILIPLRKPQLYVTLVAFRNTKFFSETRRKKIWQIKLNSQSK